MIPSRLQLAPIDAEMRLHSAGRAASSAPDISLSPGIDSLLIFFLLFSVCHFSSAFPLFPSEQWGIVSGSARLLALTHIPDFSSQTQIQKDRCG